MNKINLVTQIKDDTIQQRREIALKNNEYLRDLLQKQKLERKDSKPLAYTEDAQTTAFRPNKKSFSST